VKTKRVQLICSLLLLFLLVYSLTFLPGTAQASTSQQSDALTKKTNKQITLKKAEHEATSIEKTGNQKNMPTTKTTSATKQTLIKIPKYEASSTKTQTSMKNSKDKATPTTKLTQIKNNKEKASESAKDAKNNVIETKNRVEDKVKTSTEKTKIIPGASVSDKVTGKKSTEIHLHLDKCAKLVRKAFIQIGTKWYEMSDPGGSPLFKMKDGGQYVKDDINAFKFVTTSGKELTLTKNQIKLGVEANDTINCWLDVCNKLTELEKPVPPVTGCLKIPEVSKDAVTNISVVKGKATFTVAKGQCVEISFSSYGYPPGVKYEGGKPYDVQFLVDNVTKTYGPGTHTVQIKLPECGYFQTDLYLGPVIAKLNKDYGHPANLLLKWDTGSTGVDCTPPVQHPIVNKLRLLIGSCTGVGADVKLELQNGQVIDVSSALTAQMQLIGDLSINDIKAIQLKINGKAETILVSDRDRISSALTEGTLTLTLKCETPAPPVDPGNGIPTPPTGPGTDIPTPPVDPGTGIPSPPANPGTGNPTPPTGPGTDIPTPPIDPGTDVPNAPGDNGGVIVVDNPAPNQPGEDNGIVTENPETPAGPGGSDLGDGNQAITDGVTASGSSVTSSGSLPQTGESSKTGYYLVGTLMLALGSWIFRSRKYQGE
jgi:LPXTG-motif cell wall-anchored protein